MTATDLSLLSSLFQKKFKESSGIVDLDQAPCQGAPGEYIPTGSVSLDLAIGVGGFKRGTINEVYGPESSGKSTLVTAVVREAQRMFPDKPVAYLDCENAFNPDYAREIGCDLSPKRFMLVQENQTETLLSMAQFFAEQAASVVILDSVAAMVPKDQLESGEATDAKMGGNSKLMSTALPKIVKICRTTGTVAIYVNQIRTNVGVMFGNPEVTPGGKALDFFSSLRIRTQVKGQIKDSQGEAIGVTIKAIVKKNKIGGPPYRSTEYPLIFGSGIDSARDLADLAITKGILGAGAGGRYKFNGKKLHGKSAVYELLRDADVAKAISDTIWSAA